MRALDGHRSENSGFLRANSVLAVIFITDEDDCSVQMTARAQNNPNSVDCTKSGQSTYNCWKNDFRCLANNLKCNETLISTGAKTGCTENNNGYLESIDKYVRFFSNLRPSNKLVLAGIWTPSLLDNPNSDTTSASSAPTSAFLGHHAPSMPSRVGARSLGDAAPALARGRRAARRADSCR